MKDSLSRRLVELTRDLILIPTSCSHPEDIKRCMEFIKNHLEETEGVRIQTHHSKEIPSLVALPENQPEPQVLLCGHLDIVSLPDKDIYYSSNIADGRIYGPGAADMKGALAVLLEIFRDTHARIPEASLGLVVTSDEEKGGEHGVKFLFNELSMRCGVAIIPDAGSLNDIVIEEKGILHCVVRCHGPAGHACRPWLVGNPLERLMDRLEQIRTFFSEIGTHEENWHPTISVTIMRTENEAVNRVPSNAEAFCDVRFTPPYTVEQMLVIINDRLDDDMQCEVIVCDEPSHFSPDPVFLRVTEEITGKPVNLCQEHGASDARFLSTLDIPVVMSRPVVGDLHSEKEWIDIESMVNLYRIYERYLLKKLSKP